MRLKYIKVQQPIGVFYIISLDALILKRICRIERRSDSNIDAVQRNESTKRIKEIAEYTSDPDATFPTPIIIAVDPDANVKVEEDFIYINEQTIIGDVIDGQHRLGGLRESSFIAQFELPVVLMFNLFPAEKAYVFSIINSKHTRVNMSLIYDLFSLSSTRSPYKTCHETARAMNKDEKSPYFNRLKMLGVKADNQYQASLSQGTFIKYLLELISKNPDQDTLKLKKGEVLAKDNSLVLRNYFINEQDEIIFKIMLNLFTSVSIVFNKEWNKPDDFIISKAIGFGAIIKVFPYLYLMGKLDRSLEEKFFTRHFEDFKLYLKRNKIQLTSEFFGSNEQARAKLSKHLLDSLIANNPNKLEVIQTNYKVVYSNLLSEIDLDSFTDISL